MIVTPGGPGATLVALDKDSGEPVWTTRALSQPAAYCSPILVERGGLQIVVTIVKEGVVGVDAADGSVLWSAPQRNKHDNHMVSPLFEDGLLYVTSGYGAGGQMFRLSDDGRSLTRLWQQVKPDTMHGGVVLVDGHIYGSSNTKSAGRSWICGNAESGAVIYQESWVKDGSVVFADGHLYCYGEDGRVALVPARPDARVPSGMFAIPYMAGQHCTHPVVSGGRLYLRRGDTLQAFRVTPVAAEGGAADGDH
jgi:outer membrane protein assembly factor BamB